MENVEVDSTVLQVFRPSHSHEPSQGNFPLEDMVLNKEIFEEGLVSDLSRNFKNRQPFESGAAKIISRGYPLVVLRNFLDDQFAKELKETVMSLPFKHKATDLFDFYQSPDLKSFLDEQGNPISRVCKEIFSPTFSGTIGKIIGKPLGTEIDFAAQKYCKGQYLLCHDDRLESRRVAFVLYLVDPAWTPQDGGQFDKFGLDFRGASSLEPVESFTPSWNTLVFFEVSMWSHHQVSEVLGDLPRLSVAGWLHDLPSRKPLDLPSISVPITTPIALDELCGIFPSESILTTNSRYTRIMIPDDNSVVLNLVKPGLWGLEDCVDYPTWPTCIILDHESYFDEPVIGLEDCGRIVIFALISSPSNVKVNGVSLKAGQTAIFKAFKDASRIRIEHYLEQEQECVFVYLSFLIPK